MSRHVAVIIAKARGIENPGRCISLESTADIPLSPCVKHSSRGHYVGRGPGGVNALDVMFLSATPDGDTAGKSFSGSNLFNSRELGK
ncbi:hypothetical protein ACFY5D_17690 [Paeniglutamicibacter sp. NPDC012692]|uniref:hypothetical protein n=1 Tax=Paeniglutamicibacter sp. NPDC012692 TaxID=3364388 RepID=UPI003676A5AC